MILLENLDAFAYQHQHATCRGVVRGSLWLGGKNWTTATTRYFCSKNKTVHGPPASAFCSTRQRTPHRRVIDFDTCRLLGGICHLAEMHLRKLGHVGGTVHPISPLLSEDRASMSSSWKSSRSQYYTVFSLEYRCD